jgi:peptide deformylase
VQRSILKRGDPALEKVCAPVTNISQVQDIICDLTDTLLSIRKLYDFKRGHGVAAPQIGHLLRINVAEHGSEKHVLINPVIIDHSTEKIPIREGCLSFFGVRGNVPRYKSVVVQALNESGLLRTIHASDEFAMLLQHEIDHLEGILYIKRLPRKEEDLYFVEGMPIIP